MVSCLPLGLGSSVSQAFFIYFFTPALSLIVYMHGAVDKNRNGAKVIVLKLDLNNGYLMGEEEEEKLGRGESGEPQRARE